MKELTTRDFKKLTGLGIRTIQRLAEKGLIGRKFGRGIKNNRKCDAYIFTAADAGSEAVREAKKRKRK